MYYSKRTCKPPVCACSDGEEWHKQRVSISKFSMMPRKIAEFHDGFNTATKELLEAIEEKRDKSMVVHDASSLLFKWSFESEALNQLFND